jgi:hypothetical protein
MTPVDCGLPESDTCRLQPAYKRFGVRFYQHLQVHFCPEKVHFDPEDVDIFLYAPSKL